MLKAKFVKGALGVSAVAALFAALAVHAQGSSGTQSGAQGGAAGTSGQTSATQSSQTGSQTATAPAGARPASLSRADRKVLTDMAMVNMAEIEIARTAQNKSQNEQVKNYAQQMIDDHTRALNDVKQLADNRGVKLPSELDRAHKGKAERMMALSGDAFDKAYLSQAGVMEHQKAHDRLSHAEARAKDPEVKALVARALPVVDQHLHAAQQLHKSTAVGSSRSQGTTASSGDKSKQDKQDKPNKE